MYMHIYIYVVQIVSRKLSLTVFVTHTFIIIRCLLFGKKVFIPSFFFEFFLKNTSRIFFFFFTFFARLTTTTTPEDEPQPRCSKTLRTTLK